MATPNQENLISSNKAYASTFTKGDLALPPAKKYAVVTCMDARIDPAAAYGIALGDAHVIRNAGGNAQDALRSLVISEQLLGTTEIILVKHTGCGMLTFKNDDAAGIVRTNLGEEAVAALAEFKGDFQPFADLDEAVKSDVQLIKASKLIPDSVKVGIRVGVCGQDFVASGQEDDGEEREYETRRRADMPPLEDYTKVIGIPGEHYTHAAHRWHSTMPHISVVHSTMIHNPLNMPKWLAENSHLLKPPINNYCVYNEDVTVMIVGGPNARTDYHINETAEWFYQYKGAMMLKVVDEGIFRDLIIREGEMFLLPPNTPHNPVRFADTVGIVLEQKRPEESIDRLRWYCTSCHEIVDEAAFHCTDLGTQIKEAVNAFKGSEERRKCTNCGVMAEAAPLPGSIQDPNLS
ncbi:hypothetical protein B7494_g1979 [Chlorociboria aeruginascens]|nr:hypothetical protein B7494_g1979 [Chlorociboria aeruginascens]